MTDLDFFCEPLSFYSLVLIIFIIIVIECHRCYAHVTTFLACRHFYGTAYTHMKNKKVFEVWCSRIIEKLLSGFNLLEYWELPACNYLVFLVVYIQLLLQIEIPLHLKLHLRRLLAFQCVHFPPLTVCTFPGINGIIAPGDF